MADTTIAPASVTPPSAIAPTAAATTAATAVTTAPAAPVNAELSGSVPQNAPQADAGQKLNYYA